METPQTTFSVDNASLPFVGRWNRLVSTTNWEKGRIIHEWRQSMEATAAPASEYSDEAWARRVGGVTGQHVGRLRRVYHRFGDTASQFDGLHWSHFQAALDWTDAEMWLEGAVQNSWSVSHMRRTRWETLGKLPEDEPRESDIAAVDTDEDFEPALDERPVSQSFGEVTSGDGDEPDDGPDDEPDAPTRADGASVYAANDENESTIEFVRPFENLAELPEDLSDAFEQFKLAILNHKAGGWSQISREDVLASLDALKELAVSP